MPTTPGGSPAGIATTLRDAPPKTVSTTAGEVELAIPELRTGSFFPSLLHPRRRVDKAPMRRDLLGAGSRGWIAPGVVEGLNPWKDEDHARTQEVPR